MSFVKFKPIATYFNFHTQINKSEIEKEDLKYISELENIEYIFKSNRDLVLFTNKRIVLINKKGIRAFRKTITSVNYGSISSFNMTIHNLDTTFEFILDSSHTLTMNFFKPIPLEVMYILYNFITEKNIKKEL